MNRIQKVSLMALKVAVVTTLAIMTIGFVFISIVYSLLAIGFNALAAIVLGLFAMLFIISFTVIFIYTLKEKS